MECIKNYNNPYYNPYQQYPYTQVNTQGTQQYTQYQQMPQQPQQQIQTNYLPLTFVNGVEGAKAFIVHPNQTIYLKDSDSDLLFEKKADSQGKYTINAFKLTQVDYNKPFSQFNQTNVINYATLDDLSKLQTKLENMINEIKQVKEVDKNA